MRPPEIFVFALCILLSAQATAQVNIDSARLLQPVEVNQTRLNDYVIGVYELPIDSSALALASNTSLTDLLRKQGFGHIRSYGPGGLASPSFRGTGSGHTAVLWNGIDLTSPLTGQLDLSLLPAGLFDDVSVQTGGSTSISGNGSIGANIHLNNNLNFNEGIGASVSSHAGSFGYYYYGAALHISNKKFGSATNFFGIEAKNNFKFTNRNVFPAEVQRRDHSVFHQNGILQQLHWQTARQGIISLKFWHQKSRYEVPNATTIRRPAQAIEENEFYRALIGWNYNKENFDMNYQGAFVHQDLNYSDPAINEYSLNRSISTIHNIEGNINFKNKAQLTSGIHYTWERADVTDFGQHTPERNRVALFSAFKIDAFRKWKFAFSLREELVNGKTTPLAPTISAKVAVNNTIEVFTNLSRNYKLPTFNDLYWKGSGAQGNASLKPELSMGGEAGAIFRNSIATFKTVLFSNLVDNWILWSPGSDQIWMPQNIRKVWSRGIELQISHSSQLNSVDLRFIWQYSFTRSTNESIYGNGNPNEIGKQLLLTPMHEGSLTTATEWKKYTLRIVNAYTGEQFNDSDNSPYNMMPASLVTTLWLSKQVTLKSFEWVLSAEVNNLFNVEYQARPGYPLPGINYRAGIKINFNKPNRNEP